MRDDDYQAIAAKYLRALAQADMRVWRARRDGQDACDDETMRLPYDLMRAASEMKRVRRFKP
jgi:hypothetical protein